MLIKLSLTIGAIVGAVLGTILLIPFINSISCLILFTFVGAGIVTYLKKKSYVGILSMQDGALIGAASGFVSLIAASAIYLPVSYIISLFTSPTAKTGVSIASSILVASYSIFVLIMIVFFMALLSALFNAFSGLLAAYIFDRIENNPEQEATDFIIDD